jgi:ribosome-interacting GTPase 1
MMLNIDYMLESIWKLLNLIRVYTKKRGEKPDFEGGLIIRSNTTVEYVVSFVFIFRFTLISRSSAVWFIGQWSINSNMHLFG